MPPEGLTIGNERWRNAEIEPLHLQATESSKSAGDCLPADSTSELKCSVCAVLVERDRASVLSHYRSDWHKHNLSRTLQGKPILTEEEFEQKISDEEELSDVQSESDVEEPLLSAGVHEYFVHNQEVFSIYNCILPNGETLSNSFFTKPLNCAIFLVAGGHFTGGIFRNDQLIVHKSYHRYTVRAKQGGRQGAADARGKKAISAGASLRRYNEKMLKTDIQELIAKWSDEIGKTPLIFIRCSTYHRPIFVSDSLDSSPFLKSDVRLRSIPFETRRPSQEEMQRTWLRLKSVCCHGSVEEFRRKMVERNAQRKKKRRLLRRKIAKDEKRALSESSTDEEEHQKDDGLVDSSENNASLLVAGDKEQECSEVDSREAELTKAEMQSVYAAIRADSDEQLRTLLENSGSRRPLFETYIREARFPPNVLTFLHIAAGRAALRILPELLALGCDPSVKNAKGSLPYQVSQNLATRQTFSQFRMDNPDRWDWDRCQIPELVVMSEEKLAKEIEKRRIQRERKRQREKARKAEERIEKAKQAERDIFLALPDNEKRALAAERRLAASLQVKAVIVADDGNRCFQCGSVLPAKPFEYSDNRFCSLPCVREHRQAHPSTLPH
ncbi:Protein vms-1 [Toxocara canis]|uniref:Protein vms-1 n=1 Tax=Toxocara canis TaxID=6265 RepID=A0A0B2V9I2_TOXCA|nr:Protein vms-1 [Toxocara canis]